MDADVGDPLDLPERFAGYGLGSRLNNMRRAGTVLHAAMGTVALAGMIVFNDACHKNNPFSPVVMGLYRVLVYVTVGLCRGEWRRTNKEKSPCAVAFLRRNANLMTWQHRDAETVCLAARR